MKAGVFAVLAVALSGAAVRAQSITQALAAAYEHAPDLQTAVLAAQSSAEDIVRAQAGKLPNIGASISGNQNWSLSGGDLNSTSSLSTGLTYNQTIFDNFKTEAQIEAARAGAELAEHQIRNTEQNILLAVVQAYMGVLGDRQLLALREANIEFFRAQLRSAQDRLDVGEGTRIDVAQAEARLAQGQAAYQSALSRLEVSMATFQRYVGVPPQRLDASHNYTRLIPSRLDAALREAELGHPAILMAKAAIRAAQAGADAAEAAFGPTATINGQVGNRWSNPTGFSDGLSGQLGFQISVPIYAGGALGAGARKANIEQIKSEVDAMATYDRVREAVITAWAGIQSAEAQIQAASAAVEAGSTVLDGVIQERDLGTRTTLDVLNAQAELTSAREGFISASTNKVVATFSLLSAMGRLTAADLGLPVAVKSASNYKDAVTDIWQDLRVVTK